jgi:dethiobiotin synthetase
VTGTGTGVGKSVLAAAIVAALSRQGRHVAAFKPAVSGLDEPDELWPPDHELLARATGWQAPEQVAPHRFGPAVSPHLAADEAGAQITLDELLVAFAAASDGAELTICEGVGGLLVPLASDPPLSVLDLAGALALPVVVAARPGLGTISDTRLTVDRLRAEGLTVAGVVLTPWPDQPDRVASSNRETLRALLEIDVSVLGRVTPDSLAEAGAGLPLDLWLPSGA